MASPKNRTRRKPSRWKAAFPRSQMKFTFRRFTLSRRSGCAALLIVGIVAGTAEDDALILEESSTIPASEAPAGNGSVTENLDEIVVVATRTARRWLDTSGTVTRVDRKELAETGAQDLGDIVKYDPTVVVPFDMTTGDGAVAYAATGSASFNIRGTEGNRVGVEVDGIRQPPEYVSTSFDAGAETGAGGMGRDYFDPSMFQLVEVLKGGASALYGSDALGGMVSMTTLSAADLLGDKDWGGLARTQYFSRNEGIAYQLGGAFKKNNFDFMLLYAGGKGRRPRTTATPRPIR